MLELSLTLEQIASWLAKQKTEHYLCQHCHGLHIVRMQKNGNVSEAKMEIVDDILSYRIMVEIRQTAIPTLVAELSLINASTPLLKLFLDINDDSAPKLVIMHSMICGEGLSYQQFVFFTQQVEEEALNIIAELRQCDMLANTQLLVYPNASPSHTYH